MCERSGKKERKRKKQRKSNPKLLFLADFCLYETDTALKSCSAYALKLHLI